MNEETTHLAAQGDDDVRTSGVMVELEDLAAQSDKLQVLVDQLAERLSIVRRRSEPSDHARPAKDKPVSPLAEHIFSVGEQLRDVQGRLVELVGTVDL